MIIAMNSSSFLCIQREKIERIELNLLKFIIEALRQIKGII
jgi:hypothetical protein